MIGAVSGPKQAFFRGFYLPEGKQLFKVTRFICYTYVFNSHQNPQKKYFLFRIEPV